MSAPQPLVTIGVPTHNSARYLRPCLDSILAQTYRKVEIIVSDNASTDRTVDIVRDYVGSHGIRLIVQESNIGPGENFNRLIDTASGDFVAIYHSDDIYAPEIVARCVRIFQETPSVGLVGTMGTVIDEDDRMLYDISLHARLRGKYTASYTLDDAFLGAVLQSRKHFFFLTPSIMVRREIYRELGGFRIREPYRSAGDYEMWLRVSEQHPVAIIDEALMRYRVHREQGTEREVRRHGGIPDIIAVLDEYRGKIGNKVTQELWDRTRRRLLFATALRLNSIGMFVESSRIGQTAGASPLPAGILRFLNNRHISIGTAWYDRVARTVRPFLSALEHLRGSGRS